MWRFLKSEVHTQELWKRGRFLCFIDQIEDETVRSVHAKC